SNLFPKSGVIYFFYNFHKMTWGFDPKDRGSWKILYSDCEITKLYRRSPPGNVFPSNFYIPKELTYYQPRKLSFELDISIPFPYSRASENTELDDLEEPEDEEYWEIIELLDKTYEKLGADHRILGCPMQIQGDMELECQLVSNGLYCGDSTGYDDPRSKALEEGAHDWRLLLQLGSEDDDEGMMWGDTGYLFFWIKEQDLKSKRFDDSWCVLQCH
ncbi:MAG: YwqG family protein, partial [Gammaproteobacteria bacterium]|nr:YwqG family protein [Gammaproteobacteria bacterium]